MTLTRVNRGEEFGVSGSGYFFIKETVDAIKAGNVEACKFLFDSPEMVQQFGNAIRKSPLSHVFNTAIVSTLPLLGFTITPGEPELLKKQAAEIWRLYNLAEWCSLPDRIRFTTGTRFSRETWDAISLRVDPEVLKVVRPPVAEPAQVDVAEIEAEHAVREANQD